jgi:hypothetical protein
MRIVNLKSVWKPIKRPNEREGRGRKRRGT